MLDTLQPATGLKVWNTSPNVRYGQETIQLHCNSPSEKKYTVQKSVQKKINQVSYFIYKEQSKEKRVNAVYEKLFSVIYWFLKEEIVLSKYNSLLMLLESLGPEDKKDVSTRLPAF